MRVYNPSMSRSSTDQIFRERIEELCREGGLLILVFVPIDFAIATEPSEHLAPLLFLLIVGVILLGVGLFSEQLRLRHD